MVLYRGKDVKMKKIFAAILAMAIMFGMGETILLRQDGASSVATAARREELAEELECVMSDCADVYGVKDFRFKVIGIQEDGLTYRFVIPSEDTAVTGFVTYEKLASVLKEGHAVLQAELYSV